MIAYVDSSALVKKYVEERGTDRTRRWLEEAESISTSLLTPLELTSFLERSKREAKIDSPTYRRLKATIEQDLFDGVILLIGIDLDIIRLASRLIRQRRLRVQDAVQMASALKAYKESEQEVEFICADHSLLEAARLEGLRCHDVSV